MHVRTLAALALGASVLGCQSLERTDECRALAKLTNPVLADIDHDRAAPRSGTYRVIATKYEALATAEGQVKVRTKKIAEAVNDYQRVLHEAARDARAFAEALEAKDPTRLLLARATATHTIRHETTALSRLDTACHGH